MSARLSKFLPALFIIIVAIYFAALYFTQVTAPIGGTITEHISIAQKVVDGVHSGNIPHPGFFYSIIGLSQVGINLSISAIFVLMQAQVFTFLFTYLIYRHFLKDRVSDFTILLGALLSILLAALYLPFFNPSPYFGIGSPNVHHNATVITLEPFATLAFFLVMFQYQSEKRQAPILFLTAALLVISVLFKPTFVLAFVPALGLWILFQKRFVNNFLLSVLMFLPTVLLLGFQYLGYYGASNNDWGHTIVFFDIWARFADNIPVAILQAILFPLALCLLRGSNLKHRNLLIVSWLMILVGIVQFAFLAETYRGNLDFDANWMGGYLMGQSILFTVSILEYLEWWSEFRSFSQKQKLLFALVTVFMLAHLLSGLYSDYILFTQGFLTIP